MMHKQLNREAFTQKRRMFLLVLYAFLQGTVIIGQALMIALIVNDVFLKQKELTEVTPYLIAIAVIFMLRGVLTHLTARTGVTIGRIVKANYRRKLVTHFRRSPGMAITDGQSGEKVSDFLDTVDDIDSYFSSYFPQFIQTMIIPLMIIVVVFTQNIYSGLIMVITAPLIPIFMVLIGGHSEKKAGLQMAKLASFSGHFLDTLQGLVTLKLFNQSAKQRQVVHQKSLEFRDATMEVLKIAFLSALMLEILATIATAMIAVEVGLRLVFGHITFLTGFFVLLMAPELYLPLKNLGSAFHTGRNSMAAANRIEERLENAAAPVAWGSEQLDLDRPPTLRLDRVTVTYPNEDKPALNNLSLTIPSGANVAIVGASGAGKTTLMSIIAGLIATDSGEYLIEGIPRKAIAEEDWLSGLSYLTQHPYLFSGSLADNIKLGVPNVSSIQVERVAERAGLKPLIDQLPDGLETLVGEGGRGLSGGEKQRVALARAFISDPKVILFDEPTVGLDVKTEQILSSAIRDLSEKGTVITIAHRLHTIREADTIIVLENGEITASGNHDELMASDGPYRRFLAESGGGFS